MGLNRALLAKKLVFVAILFRAISEIRDKTNLPALEFCRLS